jgi:hypothetical protein
MQQQPFAEASFEQYRKPSRCKLVLNQMNSVVPWADLAAATESVYPQAEGPDCPPMGGTHATYPLPATAVTRPTRPWRRCCTTRWPCGSS